MKWYWVSMKYGTGGIGVDEKGIIVDSCPLWKVWKGQAVKKFFDYYDGQSLKIKRLREKV